MEQPNDASAGSSPAPLGGSEFLESLSDADRAEFFNAPAEKRMERMAKPGKAEPTPSAADAESAPAKPVEQAASTEATPKADSEPAAPAKDTKGLDAREKAVRERLARLKDDLAETTRLEREVAERRSRLSQPPTQKPDAPAESSPAAAKRAFDTYASDPRAPKLDAVDASGTPLFDSYDAWAVEMMDFISERKLEARETAAREQHAKFQQQRELDTAVETSKTRFNAFLEKSPDARERIDSRLLDVPPISALKEGDPIGPHNFVAEQIWRSEYPGELALHFSEHPEDFRALCQLNDPAAITRRIGRLEAKFSEPAEPERTTAVPKTIPDADELPVLVGRKAPVTVSDEDAALKAKDFSAYEKAWKRKNGLKD